MAQLVTHIFCKYLLLSYFAPEWESNTNSPIQRRLADNWPATAA